MSLPSPQVKTNFDAAGDDPKSARSEFAGNVDKFNQFLAHISSYIEGLLDDADAAAARTTLGLAIGTDVQALDATLTSLAAVAGVSGDILYASGTDAWARLAKGTDGEALILASGIPSWGSAGATIVVKTADEIVNASTTLQDDNHLVFALAANITYVVDLVLLLQAAGDLVPDWKFGWTVPTSCTMLWDAANQPQWGATTNITGSVDHKTESETDSVGSFIGVHGVIYRALVFNGANAGNLQLQWAQDTSDASNSTVQKYSHMIIRSLGAT